MPRVERKAPNKVHVQSVMFRKADNWTKKRAVNWLEKNGRFTDGHHETETMHRFRQYDSQSEKFQYWTVPLKNEKGVLQIMGKPIKSNGNFFRSLPWLRPRSAIGLPHPQSA